jgi:hypothetical protein
MNMQEKLEKYNLISQIENLYDSHDLAVLLNCDYPKINKELNQKSIEELGNISQSLLKSL